MRYFCLLVFIFVLTGCRWLKQPPPPVNDYYLSTEAKEREWSDSSSTPGAVIDVKLSDINNAIEKGDSTIENQFGAITVDANSGSIKIPCPDNKTITKYKDRTETIHKKTTITETKYECKKEIHVFYKYGFWILLGILLAVLALVFIRLRFLTINKKGK